MSLLTVACSLPVVTLPAALAALVAMARRSQRGDCGRVAYVYLRYFRQNFAQATIVGWVMMILGIAIWTDTRLLSRHGWLEAGFILVAALYVMTLLQLFPLMVHMRMGNLRLMASAFKLVFIRGHLSVVGGVALCLLWWIGLHFPLALILLYPGVAATIAYALFERKVRDLLVVAAPRLVHQPNLD